MSNTPHNLFETALTHTNIRTVEEYMRLICDNCDECVFLSLAESTKQMDNISENHWKCPKCGYSCDIDPIYAFRMLAQ